eukprot:1194619-Prorocentrum_minimum.AAC.5
MWRGPPMNPDDPDSAPPDTDPVRVPMLHSVLSCPQFPTIFKGATGCTTGGSTVSTVRHYYVGRVLGFKSLGVLGFTTAQGGSTVSTVRHYYVGRVLGF